MIGLAAVGAGLGACLWALAWRLARPSPRPLVVLGRYDARHEPHHPVTGAGRSWAERAGVWLVVQAEARGIRWTTLRQDVALTGRDLEAVMGRKVIGFAGGFLTAAVFAVAAARVGLGLPVQAGFVVPLVVAVGFFLLPDLEARAEAAARRRDFRRALGAYLDLVRLEMAGSAAPAEALPNAARIGAGWPLALIRDTLYRATTAGQDHWAALSDLGHTIGVTELRDLGALLRLVGQDGAQVRDTLAARATSIRARALAEAEGQASQNDQSMSLAQLLIGFGFVLFVGYPAVAAVLQL